MKNKIEYSFFGSSHGEYIGMKLRGINKGEKIDSSALQELLNRRKPTYKGSTKRREIDEIIFESGVENGCATGEEIVAKIYNRDIEKGDYERFKRYPRPSHADYVAIKKYGDEYDLDGGGQFSGRMTASMCIAGGIELKILNRQGVQI